jgi:hypothetical protein
MGLSDFLTSDEEILERYGLAERGGMWIATDKRVIRYKKKLIGEEFEDLAYDKITSLEFVSGPNALFGLGVLLLVVVVTLYVSANILLVNIFRVSTDIIDPVLDMSKLLIILSVVLIAGGIISKEAYYQIYAAGLDASRQQKWRITVPLYKGAVPEKLKRFEVVVRERL